MTELTALVIFIATVAIVFLWAKYKTWKRNANSLEKQLNECKENLRKKK